MRLVGMKLFTSGLVLAMAVAAAALLMDSPILIMTSVVVLGASVFGALLMTIRLVSERDLLIPSLAILGSGTAVTALGVAAIIIGERGDAPGLVLWGIALIVSVVVGVFVFGLRAAQRSS
jgi:hypothetical protein